MEESLVETNDRFAFSVAGLILPIVSGSFSFVSSCIIMITVLRSKQNTPYHRIMFFMSFMDALSSLSIAMTTLPMPRDVIYNYSGQSYGTTEACEAQAFGTGLVLFTNILLNIYYICKIKYNVSDSKFRQYAEPIFLLISVPLAILQPILFVVTDALNPSPYDSFCLIDVYPHECLENEQVECIRGDRDMLTFHQYVISIAVGIELAVLIITMLFIIHMTWFRQEDNSAEAKAVAIQAVMYITACLLTWVTAVIFSIMAENRLMNILCTILFPLQGFFNLGIFMFHKVYAYQTFLTNALISTFDIIKLFFVSPDKFKDQYISGIEHVQRGDQIRKIRKMHIASAQNRDIVDDDYDLSYDLPSRAPSAKLDDVNIASVDLSIEAKSRKTDMNCEHNEEMYNDDGLSGV